LKIYNNFNSNFCFFFLAKNNNLVGAEKVREELEEIEKIWNFECEKYTKTQYIHSKNIENKNENNVHIKFIIKMNYMQLLSYGDDKTINI